MDAGVVVGVGVVEDVVGVEVVGVVGAVGGAGVVEAEAVKAVAGGPRTNVEINTFLTGDFSDFVLFLFFYFFLKLFSIRSYSDEWCFFACVFHHNKRLCIKKKLISFCFIYTLLHCSTLSLLPRIKK